MKFYAFRLFRIFSFQNVAMGRQRNLKSANYLELFLTPSFPQKSEKVSGHNVSFFITFVEDF